MPKTTMPLLRSRLFTRTMMTLKNKFNSLSPIHDPSPAQWDALADLVETLEAMAEGRAEAKVFLSSLDPGIGKTSAVVSFIDQLLAHPDHTGTGVLLCINTLAEIEKLVSEAGIPSDMLCVWTSDPALNAVGTAAANEAQVLITTQARIDLILREHRSFTLSEDLYFRGNLRAVRIWDEAFSVGHPISINNDDVYWMLREFRCISNALRDDIKTIFDDIEKQPHGAVFAVPDFMGEHGLDLNSLLEPVSAFEPRDNADIDLKEQQARVLTELAYLSGRAVKIRKSAYGADGIDYRETTPEDLFPLLVLDASGRVRQFYRDMEQKRGLVTLLKSAPKSYRNLTINVWQRGGGKASWQDHHAHLLNGIVKTLSTKPTEEWLIVVHKPSRKVRDIEADIRKALPKARLHFITWGRHKAINKFAHVSNIVLAGTLFLRPSYYEAVKHLGAGEPVTLVDYDRTQMRLFEIGEHANDILQALCRGSVRRSVGDACAPCEAYIIASVRSGIPKALPTIFPDCTVQPWEPLKVTLRGKQRDAFEVIAQWLKSAGPNDCIRFSTVYDAIKVDRRDFGKRVKNAPQFQSAIAQAGLVEWGPKAKFIGYRRAGT